MAIPTHDFIWQQGEDGEISMIYKQNGVAVNLTGYELRMDVKQAGSGTVLFTFNTADSDTGGEETSGDEVAALGATGEIHVLVPRTASLTGGQLFNYLDAALSYDIFLRDSSEKQKKILKGTITIEKSTTLWT